MAAFLLRRVLQLVPVILLVTIAVFLLMRLVGDPVDAILGESQTPELAAQLRHDLGLDQPLHQQYWNWLSNAIRGDLGLTLATQRSVSTLIGQRLPVTLELGLLSMLFAIVIGVPAGIIAAARRDTRIDLVASQTAIVLMATPTFVLGLLLILVFAVWLRWVPPSGYVSPTEDLGKNLQAMALPTLSMGSFLAAFLARMTRSSVIDVLDREFVVTAKAKGLAERTILYRHVLKAALIPVVTLAALQVATVLGGSPVIETLFALPGLGALVVDVIDTHDYAVLQAVVVVSVIVVVVVNFAADAMYAYLDPRIGLR